MLGERNRVCDEVGWDLVEATSSPSYNTNNNNNNNTSSNNSNNNSSNGAHSNWTGNNGGDAAICGGPGSSSARTELNTRISHNNSRDDDDEDYENATNIQYGGDAMAGASGVGGSGGGESISVNGANAGKEVRYAPLPLDVQSPTHSNQIDETSLQRAHSR